MDKIASFTVNHLDLIPGVYVSRKDYVGKEVLTTFDLRMTAPNREPVMNTAELHTIEHLAATYLRNNDEWKEKVIYFGPMGCRTGCYLILAYKAYTDVTGDTEHKPMVIGGGTYAKSLKNIIAFGPEKEGIDYRIHGADEFILVSGMEEAVLIYMEAIKNMLAI